ncbi:hypothetical protein GGR51DRAFT_519311 [Nemania sp. FL0031]|nr:hypothetical protein GGR51DRAFT_519311 [Nemania sp. FL0031]
MERSPGHGIASIHSRSTSSKSTDAPLTPPGSAPTKRKVSEIHTSSQLSPNSPNSPGSPPQSQQPAHSSLITEAPYDIKETFRVLEIPEALDATTFHQSLSSSLGLEQEDVQVRSYSRQFQKPSCRAATVTFRKKPSFFIGRGQLQDASTKAVATFCAIPLTYVDWRNQLSYVERVRVDQDFLRFTPLSSIENESRSKIDCIVLHGFGGHAIGSYRDPNSAFTWIRDKLPKDLPELNVLTYGYDSSFNDPNSIADVYEWSQTFQLALCSFRARAAEGTSPPRPIIFIVHSLGGIVLKEAIITLSRSKNRDDQLTLMSIYGALFFGVPSQGMDTQHLAAIVSNNPTQFTVSLLDREVGSRLRMSRHEEFCRAFPYTDSKIMQWFESRKTKLPNGKLVLLVDTASSTAGRQWENGPDYIFSIPANHRDMVKFAEMDPSYDDVLYILRDRFLPGACVAIEERTRRLSSREEERLRQVVHPVYPAQSESSDSHIVKFPCVLPPYHGRDSIQYREQLVFRIRQHIQSNRTRRPTFALHGEGGVGKTQTVLKYIDEEQQHHKHIFWVNADTVDKLSSDFDQLAGALIPNHKVSPSPAANREAVKLWLQNNNDWLLVFDNADRPEVMKDFWPARVSGGCIIITSRDSLSTNLATPTDGIEAAEVTCLHDDDGARLLMSRIPPEMHDLEASKKISRRLGGLPLAIVHIASYISKDLITSLSEFLEDYDKIEDMVAAEHAAGYATLGYQRSYSTAWKMSLDALSLRARKLIDIMALLDPTDIPIKLLQPTFTLGDRNVIGELIESSLIHKNIASLGRDGASLTIHRLVQDACRRPWSPEQWQAVFEQAVSLVSRVFPRQVNGASMVRFYPDCKKYDSHVTSLARHFKSSLQTLHPLIGSLEFSETLAHCGWFHLERMQFQTSTFVLELAADMLSDANGRDQELVLALVLNNLHGVDIHYSRLDDGEERIKKAVQLRERWLKPGDLAIQELGNAYSNYANILRKRNRVAETDELFRKTLEIREKGTGATDELLHNTLYNYGSWMLELGRVEEARAFLTRALNLPNKGKFSIHLYTIYCVARLEYMSGNLDKALELHKRCLNERIEIEGWEHLLTGVSLHKVGSMLLDLGDESNGIAHLRKALHAFRQSPGDPGVLPRTLLKLGRTLEAKAIREGNSGQKADARAMIDEGVDLARRYKGMNVPLESEEDLNNLVKSTYR